MYGLLRMMGLSLKMADSQGNGYRLVELKMKLAREVSVKSCKEGLMAKRWDLLARSFCKWIILRCLLAIYTIFIQTKMPNLAPCGNGRVLLSMRAVIREYFEETIVDLEVAVVQTRSNGILLHHCLVLNLLLMEIHSQIPS